MPRTLGRGACRRGEAHLEDSETLAVDLLYQCGVSGGTMIASPACRRWLLPPTMTPCGLPGCTSILPPLISVPLTGENELQLRPSVMNRRRTARLAAADLVDLILIRDADCRQGELGMLHGGGAQRTGEIGGGGADAGRVRCWTRPDLLRAGGREHGEQADRQYGN